MKKNTKLLHDKRGVALIYVIVTASVLMLLGAATTSVAYANLKATQLQKKADTNFYSADGIMNAIVGGLAETASKAYAEAYSFIAANIMTYENVEKANDAFCSKYINALKDVLCDTTIDDETERQNYYSLSTLRQYVEDTYKDDYGYSVSATNGENTMDNFTKDGQRGIILRNIHVVYENDDGYYDEITTDIKLKVPDIGLKQLPPNPDFFNTLLVVDKGIELTPGAGVNLFGDVYLKQNAATTDAITLKTNSSLGLYPEHEAIVAGKINANDYVRFDFDSWSSYDGAADATNAYLWTEDISIGRYNNTDLTGNLFVYDDLEVNGSYSKVKLGGSYYGYSSSNENASASSAININGAHTEMDLTKLDNLIIAGSSYIKTSALESGNNGYENSKDIQMGEAFSVKSNQLAYLVDDREWKVEKGDATDLKSFVSNPMSYSQFDALCAQNGGLDNVKNRIKQRILYKTDSLEKKFSYEAYHADIVPIYSQLNGGTVYLYLKFNNTDEASNYFKDLSSINADAALRLRTYAGQYISKLSINPTTQLLVKSNYISTKYSEYIGEKGEGGTEIETIFNNGAESNNGLGYDYIVTNETKIEAYRNTIQNIIDQAKDKYGPDDPKGLKNKASFDSVINRDKLTQFIDLARNHPITEANTDITVKQITNGVILKGSTEAKAIVVDNAGKEAYELTSGTGLLIATGDVVVKGEWIGAIVSGGTVTFDVGNASSPATFQFDQTIVSSVLYLYFKYGSPEQTIAVINMYQGYENYEVAQASQEVGKQEDMIKNTISFTNWMQE